MFVLANLKTDYIILIIIKFLASVPALLNLLFFKYLYKLLLKNLYESTIFHAIYLKRLHKIKIKILRTRYIYFFVF
jgi:hypothetical protein